MTLPRKTYEMLAWAKEEWAKPGPTWLIDDFILAQGLHVISGPPKLAFKSWLWYTMAHVLTSGESRWGLNSTGAVATWTIALESPAKTTANRLLSIQKSLGVEHKETAWWSHMSAHALDSMKDVNEIFDFIEKNNIRVICFDTLSKALCRGSENDAQVMNALLRNAARLQSLGCAVVVVHHWRKWGAEQDKESVDIDMMLRGTTALAGGYDVHIGVIPGDTPGEVKWVRRSKEAEEKQFKASWYISGPETELKQVQLDLMPWDASADNAAKAMSWVDNQMPGAKFNVKRIREGTGLEGKELHEFIDGCCIAGKLEPTTKEGLYKRV